MLSRSANPILKPLIVLSLLGAVALHVAVFWIVREKVVEGMPDFGIFYTAAVILRRGESHRMYDGELQKQIQQEFAPLSGREVALPYNHPPFEALLFLPLAYLPYFPAYVLWVGLNFLLLVEAGRLLRPHVPALTAFLPWWPWLVGIGFFPAACALMQGQDSILLLLLYSLAYRSLRAGKQVSAGVFLGLGLFKFQLVLPFVFILLLLRMWRVVAGFALSGGAAILLSAAIVGLKEFFYYPHYVWKVNSAHVEWIIAPRKMPNLRGLIVGWPGVPVKPWIDVVVMIVSLCFLLWSASRWKASSPRLDPSWNSGFSIAMIATVLTSYHAYNQDMTLILLPALLLFDQWLARGADDWLSYALALSLGLLFLSPLYLILTLNYSHENLFSLVLVALAAIAAKGISSAGKDGSPAPVTALTRG